MEKLCSGDAVTKSGTYSLIAPNGTVIFSIGLKKGMRLPQTDHENAHFVFEG